jgi:hypothetical protein
MTSHQKSLIQSIERAINKYSSQENLGLTRASTGYARIYKNGWFSSSDSFHNPAVGCWPNTRLSGRYSVNGDIFSSQGFPPQPSDWAPGLPVYALGSNSFIIDDSSIDYSTNGVSDAAMRGGAGARSMDDLGTPSPPGARIYRVVVAVQFSPELRSFRPMVYGWR